MNIQAPVMPADPVPESPPVASAEARAVAPLRVANMETVARSRLLTVSVDALLVEVAALLSGAQISVVIVCDAADAAVGVITETTLVRRVGLGQADFFTTQARDAMTTELTACAREDLLSDVLAKTHTRGHIHVLRLDVERHPLGVLNARDGLRALLRNYVMGIGYQ